MPCPTAPDITGRRPRALRASARQLIRLLTRLRLTVLRVIAPRLTGPRLTGRLFFARAAASQLTRLLRAVRRHVARRLATGLTSRPATASQPTARQPAHPRLSALPNIPPRPGPVGRRLTRLWLADVWLGSLRPADWPIGVMPSGPLELGAQRVGAAGLGFCCGLTGVPRLAGMLTSVGRPPEGTRPLQRAFGLLRRVARPMERVT